MNSLEDKAEIQRGAPRTARFSLCPRRPNLETSVGREEKDKAVAFRAQAAVNYG